MTHAMGLTLALATGTGTWLLAGCAARSRDIPLGAPPPAALLALAVAAALLAPLDAGRFIALGGVAVAAVSDLRTGRIFTLAAGATAAAALAAALVENRLVPALGGSLAVGLALFALRTATRGRGLGAGDVRLGWAVGAGLGAAAGFAAFAWAFVLGAIYGCVLLALGRARRTSEIRFAPFIAAGTVLALVRGTIP